MTAGPTREFLDDVRFLSNLSSGRMGYAVAEAAIDAGHRVTLVSGPTAIVPPPRAKLVRVESARQMAHAVDGCFPDADAVVMAAAVADYRPARRVHGKIKKSRGTRALLLLPNPDILAGLGRRKGLRVLVGFALESSRGRERALEKLRAKNLDWIVWNAPEAQGATRASVEILDGMGAARRVSGSKASIGRTIVRLLEASAAEPRRLGRA